MRAGSPLFALLAWMALAHQAAAFWRLPCEKPLIVERADPIVSPGRVAGHVHTVSGGSNFALTNTFEQMRASECTSCKVKQDMSAYWTPALYFQWANGSFTLVPQVGGGLIYYLPRRFNGTYRGTGGEIANSHEGLADVHAFPDGLRVLTGNPFLRSYNSSSRMAQEIGWNCLGGGGRKPTLPTNDCPNGLRGEVFFPSCWNGVDIDSPDHFSHMAYPFENESGPCPATHPVRLVSLFYEMMWSVHDFVNVRSQALNPQQPFVLANGDPTGLGYHGDFLNGWDKAVLDEAIQTCTSDSGVIEYCTVFDLSPSNAQCAKTPDVNEVVTGTLAKLPGCNPVTPGPDRATSCADTDVPPIFSNPVVYQGASPPPGSQIVGNAPRIITTSGDWTYQDCYSDSGSSRALPNRVSTSAKTVEACLAAGAAAGYSMCGVEYHGRECYCANVDAPGAGSTALGYAACSLTCDDNATQYCGGSGPAAMVVYKRTVATSTTSTSAAATTTATVLTSSAVVSAPPTTTSTTPTSSAVATSSAAPAPSQVAGKFYGSSAWAYQGCWSDLTDGGRALPNGQSSNNTIEGCLAVAQTKGHAVAGLSYGGECWTAPALSAYSTALAATRCQMACRNSASTTCGGNGSLDIYTSTVVAPLTAPTTPDLATSSGYSFVGCYSDLVNNARSLPTGLTSNGTIEGCLAAAAARGFANAGLSYYGECWASQTLSSASTVLAANRCHYACRNNPRENCGGNAALSLYRLSATRKAARHFGRR